MNDTVITAAFKRRELKIWAVCFVAAILVNAGAILWFGTHWVELFTQIGYVVVLSVLLYVVVAGVRLVVMPRFIGRSEMSRCSGFPVSLSTILMPKGERELR